MRIYPAFLATAAALSLGACGTTRSLPEYERPLARTELQQVRTTAYTHTEADHEQYGNRTALGGILHAARPPVAPRAIPVAQPVFRGPQSGYQAIAYVSPSQPFLARDFSNEVYGSAAADWARPGEAARGKLPPCRPRAARPRPNNMMMALLRLRRQRCRTAGRRAGCAAGFPITRPGCTVS